MHWLLFGFASRRETVGELVNDQRTITVTRQQTTLPAELKTPLRPQSRYYVADQNLRRGRGHSNQLGAAAAMLCIEPDIVIRVRRLGLRELLK